MQHQIGHEIDRQIDKLDDTNKTIDETNKVIYINNNNVVYSIRFYITIFIYVNN